MTIGDMDSDSLYAWPRTKLINNLLSPLRGRNYQAHLPDEETEAQ